MEAQVEQLCAVGGFDAEVALAALQRCGGDLDEALLFLMEDGAASSPRRAPAPPVAAAEAPAGDASDESQGDATADSSESSSGEDEGPGQHDESELEETWWGEMPPDVNKVLGRWLAEHLGKLVERTWQPEYLHPLSARAETIDRGRRRTSATLTMLGAIRACRQTCRIWRDEIAYNKVSQLALDGVVCSGPVPPGMPLVPPPPPAAAAVGRAEQKRRDMIATWWPGRRVIKPAGWWEAHPGISPLSGSAVQRRMHLLNPTLVKRQRRRCPACRLEADSQGRSMPALYHFLVRCGLRRWYRDLSERCGITSVDEMRRATQADLKPLSEAYSDVPFATLLDKVRRTEVVWSESSVLATPCQECGDSDPQNRLGVRKFICRGCDMLFCSACADRLYASSRRPQSKIVILSRFAALPSR